LPARRGGVEVHLSDLFTFAQSAILVRSIFRTSTRGVKMDRNFKAPLSPNELASLRGLRGDSKRQISGSHRQLLPSMGLIVTSGDELILTEAGRRRLNHEERAPTHSSTGFVEQGPGENGEP
jgi:hypothetical protein